MRSFIWDLDGTLLDSYGIIVENLHETFKEMGATVEKNEIKRYIIRNSVHDFIIHMCSNIGYTFGNVKKRYSEISNERRIPIPPVKHAKDILEYLCSQGDENFVFTHKGISSHDVLKNLGFIGYFKEIITSQNGFPRKPSPNALNYLIEKYKLNYCSTYYVGDRTIDMECAKNANLQGILYLPEGSVTEKNGMEDYVVEDLIHIRDVVCK